MKTAFECFINAARCEQEAAASPDEVHRIRLLVLAESWRLLAKAARAHSEGEITAREVPTPPADATSGDIPS